MWAFALVAYLEFNETHPIKLQKKGMLFLGLLVGLIFYIRFLFGVIGLLTLGSYFLSQNLKEKTVLNLIYFGIGIVASYIIIGLIIFQDRSSLINYLLINNQLSFGNSIDMTIDTHNSLSSFITIGIIYLALNTYLLTQRRSLLLTANLLFLILLKLGFSRTDHYMGYFIMPIASVATIMIFDNKRFGRYMFIITICCLYYMSVIPSYPGGPKKNELSLPVDFNTNYKTRMQNVYPNFTLSEDIKKIIKNDSIDIYPYNNEYIFANNFNYVHRPLFQNYMTLTPLLDSMNQLFIESSKRPKYILWTGEITCATPDCNLFSGIDGKYSLNEDPLTTSSILLNYHLLKLSKDKLNRPIALFKENNQITKYTNNLISKENNMEFNKWYKVPTVNNPSIIKIVPKFKFTLFGRLQNILFRGSILKIKYKLISGEIKEYRLNILNSKSGVWVNPLLNNFELNSSTIDSILFETQAAHYFQPTFSSEWISVPISIDVV